MNKKEIEYQNNKVENKKVEYQSNRHKEELKEKVPQNLINKILNIVSIDQLIKLYEIDDVKEYVSTVLRNKMEKISRCQKLSNNFINEFKDKLVNIITISKISEKFITEFVDKFDKNSWFYLCQNKRCQRIL